MTQRAEALKRAIKEMQWVAAEEEVFWDPLRETIASGQAVLTREQGICRKKF